MEREKTSDPNSYQIQPTSLKQRNLNAGRRLGFLSSNVFILDNRLGRGCLAIRGHQALIKACQALIEGYQDLLCRNPNKPPKRLLGCYGTQVPAAHRSEADKEASW